MTETLEMKQTTLAIAKDGSVGVRHIDAFVKRVATTPLNEEQMSRAIADVVGDSSLLFSFVRNVIIDRREAGRYDEILNADIDPRIRASVTGNLRRVGIEL